MPSAGDRGDDDSDCVVDEPVVESLRVRARAGPASTSASTTSRPYGRVCHVGDARVMWGEHLFDMTDSTPLLHDAAAAADELPPHHRAAHLRAALARDGYLLLRAFLPVDPIREYRALIAAALRDDWRITSTSDLRMPDDGDRDARTRGLLLTGYRPLTHSDASLAVVHSPRLVQLFSTLFGEAPATLDTKWLRVMGRNERTNEHADYYRFAEYAADMYTCWIPLGDYRVEDSTLCMCEGSHRMSYACDDESSAAPFAYTDGEIELPPGYTTIDPSRRWCTADVAAGDVVVFDIRLVHASTPNQASSYRISTDTRWLPRSRVDATAPAFTSFEYAPL